VKVKDKRMNILTMNPFINIFMNPITGNGRSFINIYVMVKKEELKNMML